MKNIAIVLFVIFLGYAQAVNYCCTGSYDTNNPLSSNTIIQSRCPGTANDVCLSNVPVGSSLTDLGCGSDSSVATTTCESDYCNCPSGFGPRSSSVWGDMKKIMYPVMGVIFGVIWIILAFLGAKLPLTALLIVIGLLDAIFGLFLIFLPVTTFLGLFYMAVGAFTIAVSRHAWGGNRGIDFLLALTIIVFLLTGGLTFVAFDFGGGRDYVHRVAGYYPLCDNDMNIVSDDGGRSTRCGNYAFFVAFCVFLLFLIQPIAMIAAAFKRVAHRQETTVVVNEKRERKKSTGKNNVNLQEINENDN
jgi:hypothetical protein